MYITANKLIVRKNSSNDFIRQILERFVNENFVIYIEDFAKNVTIRSYETEIKYTDFLKGKVKLYKLEENSLVEIEEKDFEYTQHSFIRNLKNNIVKFLSLNSIRGYEVMNRADIIRTVVKYKKLKTLSLKVIEEKDYLQTLKFETLHISNETYYDGRLTWYINDEIPDIGSLAHAQYTFNMFTEIHEDLILTTGEVTIEKNRTTCGVNMLQGTDNLFSYIANIDNDSLKEKIFNKWIYCICEGELSTVYTFILSTTKEEINENSELYDKFFSKFEHVQFESKNPNSGNQIITTIFKTD